MRGLIQSSPGTPEDNGLTGRSYAVPSRTQGDRKKHYFFHLDDSGVKDRKKRPIVPTGIDGNGQAIITKKGLKKEWDRTAVPE